MLRLIVLFSLIFAWTASAEEVPVQTLTEDELKTFEFPDRDNAEEDKAVVEPLSVGQKYILNTQRTEIKELIARDLGIMSLEGNESDLAAIQSLYDRRILREDDVRQWQSVGILFGDILVNQYDFKWVSYEDELGASKALQWRDTRNFVFPITVFSKRLEFGEEIDARAIYDKISKDIEQFIAYEQRNRELSPGSG